MFSTLSKTEIFLLFNLSSANAFNLVSSKISSFGNELTLNFENAFKYWVRRQTICVLAGINGTHGASNFRCLDAFCLNTHRAFCMLLYLGFGRPIPQTAVNGGKLCIPVIFSPSYSVRQTDRQTALLSG